MGLPSKLFVTGGAGFIGANFVHHSIARGARVLNFDKLTYAGNPDNLADLDGNPAHRFAQGDIRDRARVLALLIEYRPDALVHFAAESHVDRSIDGPGDFINTNVVGTFELLEATRSYLASLDETARNTFRFLHVSTDEVYGSLEPGGTFNENSRYAPNSPYAASKAAADHLVRAYHKTYSLPVVTTNCSNNYGPYQFPEKLIPLTIMNALEGRDLPIYGDGLHVRDWLYVEDHCAAIMRALEIGGVGETFVIGGSNERTNLDLVNSICGVLEELQPSGSNPRLRGRGAETRYADLIRFVADRPGHDRRYAVDSAHVRRELGWAPAHSFELGLRKTVEWYLVHRAWCARVSSGGYRRERLGLGGASSAGVGA